MYTPTPSFIRVHELRREEMLAKAAQYRLLHSIRQSSDPSPAKTAKPRFAFTRSYARYLVGSLASVAFVASMN